MTAGGGIVHEELQSAAFSKRGGLLHGVDVKLLAAGGRRRAADLAASACRCRGPAAARRA